MADNPRQLKEIQEFRDLLNAKDEAMKVVAALTGDSNAVITPSVSVNIKSGGLNLSSPSFNKYLTEWLVANMPLIAPDIVEMLETELEKNRQEAEQEASWLGLVSSPALLPAPVINSPTTADAIIGQVFTYNVETQNATIGMGITFAECFVTGRMPDWLNFDRSRRRLTGTVPASATPKNTVPLTILVSTNVGIATQPLTLTYREAGYVPGSTESGDGTESEDGTESGDGTEILG